MTMHSYEAEDKLLMKTMQPNNSLTLEPNMVTEVCRVENTNEGFYTEDQSYGFHVMQSIKKKEEIHLGFGNRKSIPILGSDT